MADAETRERESVSDSDTDTESPGIDRYLTLGRFRPFAIGIAAGWLAGTAMYVQARPVFMPFPAFGLYPLLLVVFSALVIHPLTGSIKGSVYAVLTAFSLGVVIFLAGWLLPLWILPYDPAARQLLLPGILAEAVTISFTWFPYYFFVSYVIGVVLDKYLIRRFE